MDKTVPVIDIRDVCFAYDDEEVLHNINLQVQAGVFAVVVGPNGGGKTTLLRLILGLLTPRFGDIVVFGRSPAAARRLVGYVPQALHVDAQFPATVLDVVLMGRVDRHRFGPYRRADREAAQDALQRVGLGGHRGRSFSALSGGERQRVLIAQALASEPELLLLDEPGANLDPESRHQLYSLLRELNRRLTIILVSHNLKIVESYASHVICVNRTAAMHRIEELQTSALADGEWLRVEHKSCPVDSAGVACLTPHLGEGREA
ncbi:MAG: metal ABC transporter ATP-binding protein [Lentisphaeria bacterium]|jgi:zinc transport system ATP-binding protein